MKDIATLMQAIADAYNLGLPPAAPERPFVPIFAEGRWFTHCNEAFNFICKAMGYLKFDLEKTPNPTDAKLAAQIYSLMMDPAGDWREITSALGAQELANQGGLVAAIFENPDGPDHVCVVMPGKAQFSPSWNDAAPSVMNVGRNVFIGKRASFAFTSKERPRYFTLKEKP